MSVSRGGLLGLNHGKGLSPYKGTRATIGEEAGGGTPVDPGDALLLERGTDFLLLEGTTDKLLLEA